MTRKFPWFRLYANDLLGDRKIQRIHKQTGISLAEIRGLWLTLLCLASESTERGRLSFGDDIPLEYDDLVEECGMETMKFHAVFNHFISLGMVALDESGGRYYLPNWEDRQPNSDTSAAERSRKYREKKKESVTSRSRDSHSLEREEESESEPEREREPEPEEDSAVVFSHFQNEITMLTPGLAERVGSWLDRYPRDWILKAIDVAVGRNKRRPDYIEGILKNWKANGISEGKKTLQTTKRQLQEAGYEPG